MAISDFLIFANGIGANVEDQLTYSIDPTVSTGCATGIALSALSNKIWRQGTTGTFVLSKIINVVLNVDCPDDGIGTLMTNNLATAFQTINYAQDISTIANVMLVNLPISPIALQNGLMINIQPALANTTSVTLNLNGLGAKPLWTPSGPLIGGELIANMGYSLIYLSSLSTSGAWLVLNFTTTCTTQSSSDSSTKLANTQFVQTNFAPLNSPHLTGIPTAPTAAPGTSTTQLATTAFAQSTGFPSGTRIIFDQAVAPAGWTRDISDRCNNRMIVLNSNTTFTATSGVNDPTINNVVPAHIHSFTTGTESNTHTHVDSGHTHNWPFGTFAGTGAYPGFTGSGDHYVTGPTATGYANLGTESTTHTHSGTTDNGSSQTNWVPRILYTIVCQKN